MLPEASNTLSGNTNFAVPTMRLTSYTATEYFHLDRINPDRLAIAQ